MSRKRYRSDDNDDERDLLSKAAAGDFHKLDAQNGVQAARMATGLLPGGYFIDPALAAVDGGMGAEREKRKYRRIFGNLDEKASHSRGLRRWKRDLASRWTGRGMEAAVSAGGALAGAAGGAALGTMILGPVGTIGGLVVGGIGSLGGGLVANKLYNRVNPWEDHYAVKLAADAEQAQAQGAYIPPGAVLVLLASNLPDRDERLIRAIDKAYMKGDEAALQRLASAVEVKLHRILPPSADPSKTLVEQYTEMVNSGQIRPSDLLSAADPQVAMQMMQGAPPLLPEEIALPSLPPVPGVLRGIGKF